MTNPAAETAERRSRTQDVIDKLLAERQEMLVLYCRVAGLEPYNEADSTRDVLRDFLQVLVDYSAFGHFEIYERIVDGQERRAGVVKVAQEVYPVISEASESAVRFNDKYDTDKETLPLDELGPDLSRLGQEIAERIEMEDRVLAALTAR